MPGTRKLGKTTDQRRAMLRQQVTDFLDKGKMETTITRAKEIRPLAEKMITLGKKGDLAAYRQAMTFITREDVVKKIFKEIAPNYAERNGGYTRITRTGVRRGDAVGELKIYLKNQLLFCQKIVSIEDKEKSYFDILRELTRSGRQKSKCESTNTWPNAASPAAAPATG